uniref:Uncharacterized protein n=1 Tax=Ditylenchus dipsaci TaxID=166011 RepID=A0A915DDF9_9BILA
MDRLYSSQIVFRSDIAFIEYLSSVDDCLEWTSNGMPKHVLCVENVISLHRFDRYALIIGPSAQSMDYLMKQFPSIQKTGFHDNSFREES